MEDVGDMPDRNLYRTKRYRSFVAVTVSAGSQTLGMLAVDAPEPSRFDRTHLGILLALAGLAAIALSIKGERVATDNEDDLDTEG